jgi:acyl-CoA reductase-like NAD-dependent aldehyde dehydrogenase
MHRKLFRGSFMNTGQICVAMKRIYIHENVYEAVRDALVEYAKTVKVGDPLDPLSEIGPVQNQMQFEKVKYVLAHCNTTPNLNSHC